MLNIGKINTLKITRRVDFGVYLDGHEYGEILLPGKYVPTDSIIGSEIEVIVYLDSEDRLIATTESPLAMVGEFCMLKTIMVTPVGAFLDWGLAKDLLVPFREQKQKMVRGKRYLVFIYIDEATDRIVASSKLDKFLSPPPSKLRSGDEIEALIAEKTDLGYKVIINNSYPGMLYKNELFREIKVGQRIPAYIKKIREDEKIDVSLHPPGFKKVNDITDVILTVLKSNGGFMPVNDKTAPDEIYSLFGVSKKTFKKALGVLYKEKRIFITNEGIKSTE